MSEKPEFPFDFEFYNKSKVPDDNLSTLAYEAIMEITEGHDDIVGASISLEELSSGETPHAFQVSVVLYVRPNNIFATETMPSALDALKSALEAVTKQVRKKRDKLKGYK